MVMLREKYPKIDSYVYHLQMEFYIMNANKAMNTD